MINRRYMLQGSLALSVAGFSLPALARLSKAHPVPTGTFQGLSREQTADLAWMTETIIPATDSPGAMEAGVADFIQHMLHNWMTEVERQIFLDGLQQVGALAQREYGENFASLDTTARTEILSSMEREVLGHSWYALGNIDREMGPDIPFICQLKELTAFGFFTSEVGATQCLKHTQMPGYFDPDVPLAWDDPSWAPMPEM